MTKKKPPRYQEIRILGYRGKFYINASAMRALGNPPRVLIRFKEGLNTFTLQAHPGGYRVVRGHYIAAPAFWDWWRERNYCCTSTILTKPAWVEGEVHGHV
jgi:hypothetical protein